MANEYEVNIYTTMSRLRLIRMRRCLLLFLAMLCLVSPQAIDGDSSKRQSRLDSKSLAEASEKLQIAVLDAVKDAGGDAQRQHIHLVLAFSTGHFAKHPLSAQGTRFVASSLLKNLLITGDSLSVYCWEMDLWEPPQSAPNPVSVPANNGAQKEKLQDLWPLTPQAGSLGGHDTELAITRILHKLGADSSAIVVLLTNTASSISNPNNKVIGQDSSDYLSALQNWKRLPQVNESGASVVLPLVVVRPDGTRHQITIDAVIIAPVHFAGSSLGASTRSARLSRSAETPLQRRQPPPRLRPNWGLLASLVVFIAVVTSAAVAWTKLARRSPSGLLLEIAEQRFDLTQIGSGEEICHIAGPGFPSATKTTVVIGKESEVPPVILARFIKDGGGVIVQGDRLKLHSVNGAIATDDSRLKPDIKYRIALRGEYSVSSALPPRQVQIEIEAMLRRGS